MAPPVPPVPPTPPSRQRPLAARRRPRRAAPIAAGLLVALAGAALPADFLLPAAHAESSPPVEPRRHNADAQLPITHITLYRSGVGSFQRTAALAGDRSLTLRFGPDQVNDILQSLLAIDRGGGAPTLRMPTKEPLDKRLGAFGIDINRAGSVVDLLRQLRGTDVTLETIDGELEGAVMAVEMRMTDLLTEGAVGHYQEPFVVLNTGRGLVAHPVSEIRRLRIADERLAGELDAALAALAEHRSDRAAPIHIDFHSQDDARRDVMVSYVHETPVWKTSYRLVLPESTGEDLAIQGWAIVENTTSEDWSDVRLSLAAGRPVSFSMNLAEPLYLKRPVLDVPVLAGVMPKTFADGVRGRAGVRMLNDVSEEAILSRFAPASPAVGRAEIAGAAATGALAGGQFLYTLDMPVSIDRGQSAMLPILAADLTGSRVSIYSPDAGTNRPMLGVRFQNNSGMHLMPGPIAVYDGGVYAGDALIGHTPDGEDRLLAFAVDLDVSVDRETDQTRTVTDVRIADGMIVQTTRRVLSHTYTIDNTDDRERTVVLEHRSPGGWSTRSRIAPYESAGGIDRFAVPVPAGETVGFEIDHTTIDEQRVALTSFDEARLAVLNREGAASDGVLEAFRRAASIQADVNTLDRRIARTEGEINSIAQDQDRIRRNMSGIDRGSDLYARYMTKLNEQETALENLRSTLDSLRDERDRRRRELNDFISNLDVR